MAEVTRTTQAGKVLVGSGDPAIRTTQAGKVIVASVEPQPGIRATQAGKVLVARFAVVISLTEDSSTQFTVSVISTAGGATDHELYVKAATSSGLFDLGNLYADGLGASPATIVVSGRTPGTLYYVGLRAIVGAESFDSSPRSITMPAPTPETPSASVDLVTTTSARLTGSAYDHPLSTPHFASQFRVLDSGDGVLFDSGVVGAVAQYTATGLPSGTGGLKPQIRYQADDTTWSAWGEGAAFATLPEAPVVEANNVSGQSARAIIGPVDRDLWKVRVRLSSTLAVVYTSDEIDGSADLYQLPAVILQPSTAYKISGAVKLNGVWSGWGVDFAFTTLSNRAPAAPGAWLSPVDASSHSELVSLISDPASDPDGDDLSYETEFSVDGAAWLVLGGTSLAETHTLLYPVGTAISYRRRAFDGIDYGPWGDVVSITVSAAPAKPELLYVELTGPGEVRGVLGDYVGTGTHASSRYQIQDAGGTWGGVDLVDSGYVGGANLYTSPAFGGLLSTVDYEMRALQRSDADVDTAWSDAMEFSPLKETTSFDEASPLSGFTGDTGNFEVLEVPGTHGGTCLVDKSPGTLVWTSGGFTSGVSARVMNHWNAEHQSAPIVLVGGLGHTLRFSISPGVGGYVCELDFYRQQVTISRSTEAHGFGPVPGAFVKKASMPPDRWLDFSFFVGRGGSKVITYHNCNPPPILITEGQFFNRIGGYINGTYFYFEDFGWADGYTCISALDIPVSGYLNVHMGFVGEGMRRIDYLATGGGVTTAGLETFAAPGVSGILTPSIVRPRAGEVFDATMPLDLGTTDTYQVSSDGGETWGPDVAYTEGTTLDVSAWANGYTYMIRAKRGVSAWAYSQKISIDHRVEPICFYRYFGDEEWGDVDGMTQMWEMDGVWLFWGQYERQALPPNALIHGLMASRPSAITDDAFPVARNGEIRALLRNYHDISGSGVFGRGSGVGADARGYWASCVKAWYNHLYRRGGGYEAQLSALPSFRHGAPMMVAMRIVEGRIGVKHWVADSREPDEWMVVRDDPAIDEAGLWGVARSGLFYESYPGNFEMLGFVNLDEEKPPPIPEPDPQPFQGAPCTVVLQVYDEDRETVRWEVGDDALHPNSFLCVPEHYGEQELDFVEGAATIGQVEVVVIDRNQTIGDQDSGWMTERLSEGGIGAIHGRRCRLLRFISYELGWVVIADGPASSPRMDDTYAAYRWTIRDTRDTERKIRAFVKTDTSWLLPMGAPDGFGEYENRDGSTAWLVSPADPLVGSYVYNPAAPHPTGYVSLYSYWAGGIPTAGNVVDPAVVILPATEQLAACDGEPLGSYFPVFYEWPKLEVLWRISGSGDDWTVVQVTDVIEADDALVGLMPQARKWPHRDLIFAQDAVLADGTEVRAAYDIMIQGQGATGTFPTHGDTIEVAVRYNGAPTEFAPLHIEGLTVGELLKKLYNGDYCEPDPITGVTESTGIRYEEDDLLAMTTPVLLRITSPVDDLRDWTEKKLFAPAGWCPALDNDGQISPQTQVPPDTWADLTDINNAITEPVPDWNAGERIVNILDFTYPRLYPVEVAEAESCDLLAVREVYHEYRESDEASITRHSEQRVSYEGDAFAAIGDTEGRPVTALEDEVGYQLSLLRKLYIFDRYVDGAQIIQVPVMRDYTATLRAGDWVTVDLSWFPDYLTQRRGFVTGGQILAIHDVDCAWRILLIEEAFPLEEES
jgi:hypothetical protein